MVIKNRLLRTILFILGFCSVAAGIVGIFLPLIPTTPFILFAAWCFVRSSHRAHQWLYRQPLLGQALVDWDKHRTISRSTKRLAVITILISCSLIWFKVANIWVKGFVTILLLSVVIFITQQKENHK